MQALTTEIIRYIKKQYGAEPEFLWASNPDNAAIRYSGNKKWFAALLLNMPRRKLKLDDGEPVDVINLKCDPLLIGSFLDGKGILPGYHMNKEHWISVLLDGSVGFEEICSLVDISYNLISKNKK